MSHEVLKRVGCLITSTLHARCGPKYYAQRFPPCPGAGLPISILVVVAGLVYWQVPAAAREQELGSNSLNPPYEGCYEADGRKIISRKSIVAGSDAPEILQPVKCALDAPPQLIEAL